MLKSVSVIGAGSFGTALAVVLGNKGHKVSIWARESSVVDGINKNRRNPDYISDIELPDKVNAFRSIREAVKDSNIVLFATPTKALRSVSKKSKASSKRG